jgi:hypothetical protein
MNWTSLRRGVVDIGNHGVLKGRADTSIVAATAGAADVAVRADCRRSDRAEGRHQ